MNTPTGPLMRYHGGKWRLAPWLIGFFPPHTTYVEPFGGAASVLMQKPRSRFEVYNDLDDQICTVFRVLQDPAQAARLEALLRLTPYARREFERAYQHTDDPVESARRTLIRAFMGFGSSGATKGTTGFRNDTTRLAGPVVTPWISLPDRLQWFTQRLTGVIVENMAATRLLAAKDTPNTLFYVDPPYLHETRVMNNGQRYYRFEMSNDDHRELIATLQQLTGMVVLNGYQNPLYQELLGDWQRFDFSARASANRGTAMRVESVWLNPACSAQQQQLMMDF